MGNKRNASRRQEKKNNTNTIGRPSSSRISTQLRTKKGTPEPITEVGPPKHRKPRPRIVLKVTPSGPPTGRPESEALDSDVLAATQGLLGPASGHPSRFGHEPSEHIDSEVEMTDELKNDDIGGNLDGESLRSTEEEANELSSDDVVEGMCSEFIRLKFDGQILSDPTDLDSFELEFMIPIDGALDSVTFESDITWTEFCYRVADEMGVKKDTLRLAYKFSTLPQKQPPQILSRAGHLEALFNVAKKELETRTKSKAKAKSLKPFKVLLFDQNAGKRSGSSRSEKKRSGKGKVKWLVSCEIISGEISIIRRTQAQRNGRNRLMKTLIQKIVNTVPMIPRRRRQDPSMSRIFRPFTTAVNIRAVIVSSGQMVCIRSYRNKISVCGAFSWYEI